MRILRNLPGQAGLVFVLATVLALWLTGNLHFGPAPAGEVVADDPHAGHGHEPGEHVDEPAEVADDPHAGHGHEAEAPEPEEESHVGHGCEKDPTSTSVASGESLAEAAREALEELADPHAGPGHETEAAHEEEDDPHAGHEHEAEAAHEEEDDPHAGHEHEAEAAHEEEDDPHAGHGHEAEAAHEEEDDPHAGHEHEAEAAHEEEDDPHAGHEHEAESAREEEDDPHAGHEHEAEAAHEEEDDPHAGHGHEAEAAREVEDDPHAGHDHSAGVSDWCAEHGVPESACTRCNPELIAGFKARGDWCGGHGVPESQCEACNPGCLSALAPRNASLDSLEERRCEHDMRTVDCDNCRFEVGVVKVEPSVAANLLRLGRVELRSPAGSLKLTGEVQLDRKRVVEVPAPVGGRILTVAVDLGQSVRKGELLAVLHSGEIARARALFLEATTVCEIAEEQQARRAEMTAALRALLASLPGEMDKPLSEHEAEGGDEPPQGLLGEWRSKLLSAAARQKAASIRHERERDLEEKGISARAEHEEAHRDYEAAKAHYEALIEEATLSLELEKLKADSAAKQACASVIAAEQGLRVFGLREEDLTGLSAGTADDDFARLELRAPRSGTVTTLDVSVGHFVDAGEALFTVADLSHLWVWCDLYERDLALVVDRVESGDGVEAGVFVASYPEVEFEGVLDLLGSTVDIHTRTVKARIRVPNAGRRLRPGMFAEVALHLPGEEQVRVVPRNAVQRDEGVSFLFQHWRDDLWVRRDVVVRDHHGDHVVIEGDVPVGARIVTGGAFMLKSDVLRNKMGAG